MEYRKHCGAKLLPFYQNWMAYFAIERIMNGTEGFSRYDFTLLLIGFGKSLVKHKVIYSSALVALVRSNAASSTNRKAQTVATWSNRQ